MSMAFLTDCWQSYQSLTISLHRYSGILFMIAAILLAAAEVRCAAFRVLQPAGFVFIILSISFYLSTYFNFLSPAGLSMSCSNPCSL